MTDTVYFRRLAITIAALAAAVLLWWLKIVILLLFAAVIIAILIRSLSNPIRMRFRLVDAAAVAIAIGILAVLTMVAFALFGWRMAGQFAQPLVTLFALVLFGVVLGPLGVVLATPLTILTAEAIDYVRSRDS